MSEQGRKKKSHLLTFILIKWILIMSFVSVALTTEHERMLQWIVPILLITQAVTIYFVDRRRYDQDKRDDQREGHDDWYG